MRTKLFLISALAACICTACGESSAQVQTEITVPEPVTEVTTISTEPVSTSDTTAASVSTTKTETHTTETTTETETTVSQTAASVPLITTVSTTVVQGGQGGEQHAADPNPLYFNYRFSPERVSMRLAGGNYQTILYDFEAAIEHDVDSLYSLTDYNFDGNPDLCVPVIFADANITYAVFLWDADMMYFTNEPFLLCNPSVDAERSIISSLTYDGAHTAIYRTFRWDNDVLAETLYASADFQALTLTTKKENGEEQTDLYDSSDALKEAFEKLN